MLLTFCLPASVLCPASTLFLHLWEGLATRPLAGRPTLTTAQPRKSHSRNTTAAAQDHYGVPDAERDDENSYDREAADRYDSYSRRRYDAPDEYYRRDWPECWGSCFAGSCYLDQSRPGCCYLPQEVSRDHNSPYSALQEQSSGTGEVKGVAQPAYRVGGDQNSREGLICWEGEQQYLQAAIKP